MNNQEFGFFPEASFPSLQFGVVERRCQELFAETPVACLVTDSQGLILACNPKFESVYGWTRSEVIGCQIWEIIGFPTDRDRDLKLLASVFSGASLDSIESLHRRANGSVCRALCNYVPLRDAHGAILGCVSLNIVSDAPRENPERNQDNLLRTVIANAPAIQYALDKDGIFTMSEGRGLETLGLRAGQLVGQSVYDVYRDAPDILHSLQLAYAGLGQVFVTHVGDLTFEAHYTPIRDDSNQIVGLVGLATDVTERTRIETALRHAEDQQQEKSARLQALTEDLAKANASLQAKIREQERTKQIRRIAEQKYRSIFDNAIEGIFQATTDGSYVTANPAVARIFGYDSVDEMLLLPNVWPKSYVESGRHAAFMEQVRVQGSITDFESQVHRKDGTTFWISETVRTVYSETGQLLYYEGIVQDITARKYAEQEIMALNGHLERRWQRIHAMREIDLAINSNLDLSSTLDVFLHHVSAQPDVTHADVLLYAPQSQSPPHPDLTIHESGQRYSVPLMAKGQVRGVLEVSRTSSDPPDSEWIDFLESLAGHAAIAIDNAALFEDLQRSNLELTQAYDATIEGWSRALDLRDKETEGHTLRVVEMTLHLAQEMGIDDAQLGQLRRGALLHDIGKMGIPDSILLKPGKLTQDEWIVMRMHPTYAYEMLLPITFLRSALDIPYCHHEKWDGTGYPQGLSGETIPLVARIFAVVDVWDALRSDRPYRRGWPEEKVLAYIQSGSGTHFDPTIVDVFLKLRERERLPKT